MAATAAAAGALYISAPPVTIVTALTTTTDAGRKNFEIVFPGTPALNACMSHDDTVTVQHNDGGTYHDMLTTEYVLDRLGGVVRSIAQQGVGILLKVTVGKYLPLRRFCNAKQSDITIDRKNWDTTTLCANTTMRMQGTVIDAKGTLTNFYDPRLVYDKDHVLADTTQIYDWGTPQTLTDGKDAYFLQQPLGETWIVIQHWIDATTSFSLMAWCKVSQEVLKAMVNSPIDETVQWEGDADFDGHMVCVEGLVDMGDIL